MSNTVLEGLVYQICELYIDDVLIHVRKVFERLREFNVTVNPAKTKLRLSEVEYVGYVISITGTSFNFRYQKLKRICCSLLDSQTI